jgi:ribonuclease HI
MKIEIYTDGSSNLKNKRSGRGFIIYKDGVEYIKWFAGSDEGLTNNQEEYNAIIEALIRLKKEAIVPDEIIIKTDSELVVKQLLGIYKIKKTHLKILFNKIKELIKEFSVDVKIMHIKREYNTKADNLAKQGMLGEKNV